MNDRHAESGFTLVEVLVTVLILGLLAAVVFPVVANRAGDADPTVVSNDLANIRSGAELFLLDMRNVLPGDVEDLVNRPSTAITAADIATKGNFSSGNNDRWDGPYVDLGIASNTNENEESVRTTGFDGQVVNDFKIYDPADNTTTTTASAENFLAVRVDALATSDFNDVDEQIDGSDGELSGKVRFLSGKLFFLALPLKN